MKIQNQTNYAKTNQINFKSNLRTIRDETGRIIYRNTSSFFRDDINWSKFTDFIIEKYKDAKKVNVHCFACSEGAEPFSLAMILNEKLGAEKAKKFFPIIASDIDEEILKNPKSGIIKPSIYDIELTKFYMGPEYKKYITHGNQFTINEMLRERVTDGNISELLKDKVIFKKIDMLKDNIDIPSENTIVLCRNVWPYLGVYGQQELAEKFSQRLGKNSMLMLGGYDSTESTVANYLKSNNFTTGELEHLYLPKDHMAKDSPTNPNFWLNQIPKQ